ncbi:hypothetical protein Taro_005986 [Colocasia esculenta]|uniref:Uncharacterized protein n=1 Tax=Colocasia esculenta TaxID=4460 RepID=A0A843TRE3_COLES|nr:hypothetical protein [Colocasia esculenta]
MSSAKVATDTPTTASSTTTTGSAPNGGGGRGVEERKVVETVEYRSSAGQAPGEAEKRQVKVVHEYPAAG